MGLTLRLPGELRLDEDERFCIRIFGESFRMCFAVRRRLYFARFRRLSPVRGYIDFGVVRRKSALPFLFMAGSPWPGTWTILK